MLIAKKKRVRDIASIALGFGILFMGMGGLCYSHETSSRS